jgi:hypothetical protein
MMPGFSSPGEPKRMSFILCCVDGLKCASVDVGAYRQLLC